jgi:hypothetical protein
MSSKLCLYHCPKLRTFLRNQWLNRNYHLAKEMAKEKEIELKRRHLALVLDSVYSVTPLITDLIGIIIEYYT